MNIVNAANFAKKNNINLITFSGFSKTNKLKNFGDYSFWVDSTNYNYVEMTHHVWLLSIVDRVIEISK